MASIAMVMQLQLPCRWSTLPRLPCNSSKSFVALHSPSAFLSRDLPLAFNSPAVHDYAQLLPALVPAGVAALGCSIFRMGAEKEIVVAISRSSIQLFLLAFALKVVFEGDRLLRSVLAVTFMVIIAGHTAAERANELPYSRLIATSSLAVGTLGTLGLMIFLKALPLTPRYIIPTAGYVIGNAMSMVGATLNGLYRDVRHHEGQIEAALSLGASPQQAVQRYIQRAVVQGMAPWIDSIKTAGLIVIPGSMTGMLMGGLRPLEVVQMQLQLLYMLLGAAALSSAISSVLGWRVLFSKSHQLVLMEPGGP